MKEYNFFAMLDRMKYINRWGLMRPTMRENIAEHSLDTAILAHGLAMIGNIYFGKQLNAERIAVLAIFHDVTEIITGDMPTPIKYFAPEIREAYQQVEHYAGEQMVSGLPEQMQEEYRTLLMAEESESENWKYVKAADKLSAYMKCVEERNMGNRDFAQAEKTTRQAVESLGMEEVAYFLEHFLPAYEITLDEQI